MPKELQEESIFNKTIALYKSTIKKERYQKLSLLLNKLTNICKSSNLNVEPGVPQPELIKEE